jgi:hypothetical protein
MQHLIDAILNGPTHYATSHHFDDGKLLAFVAIAFILEVLLATFLIFLLIKLGQYSRTFLSAALRRCSIGMHEVEYTFLQLTFPSNTTKSAYATEQLHILLRSMVGYSGFWDRLAAQKQPYSLELVASRDEGIRYIIRVPKEEAEVARRTLLSFLPGIKIAEVDDYLNISGAIPVRIAELKLTGDFVLPLTDHKALDEHDPIAYLTGHMRNLLPEELISFQIVAVPVLNNTHPNELRHMYDITHLVALSQQITPKLTPYKINVRQLLWRTACIPLWLIAKVMKVVVIVADAFSGDSSVSSNASEKRRKDNPYELELGKTIKSKLDQHQFEVTMRVLVASPDADGISDRVNAIVSSFGTFTTTGQAIGMRKSLPVISSPAKWYVRFRDRKLVRHIFTQ